MIDENIKFNFKLDNVGVSDVGEFIGVVSEIRYYFVGVLNDVEKQRFYVQKINTSNLQKDTFKDILDVTREELLYWLERSIDPQNLSDMKQSIHEQFYPPIRYLLPGVFKEKGGS